MMPTPLAGTHCTPQASQERTNLYSSCWRMVPEYTCRTGAGRRHRVSHRAGTFTGLLDPFRPHKSTAELLRNLGAVASCLTLPRNTRLERGHCPHLSIYFISVLKILGVKGWPGIFPQGHIDLFGRPDQKIDSPLLAQKSIFQRLSQFLALLWLGVPHH